MVDFTLRTKKNDVLNVANFIKHSLQLNICSYDQNDLPVKKKLNGSWLSHVIDWFDQCRLHYFKDLNQLYLEDGILLYYYNAKNLFVVSTDKKRKI